MKFDAITFPTDTSINNRNVRSYMAVAMILWYAKALLAKYDGVWEALKYAWLTSLCIDSDLVNPAECRLRVAPQIRFIS